MSNVLSKAGIQVTLQLLRSSFYIDQTVVEMFHIITHKVSGYRCASVFFLKTALNSPVSFHKT